LASLATKANITSNTGVEQGDEKNPPNINAIIIIQSDKLPVINERNKDKIYLLIILIISKFQ
jgi:hypothetical protein